MRRITAYKAVLVVHVPPTIAIFAVNQAQSAIAAYLTAS